MRGRMKLAGIVAVILVVALGIGLTFRMLDTPANADTDKAVTATKENEEAYMDDIAETMAFFEETLEKCAVDTVEIDGYTYGVLENGETFGPAYFYTEYNPDWVTALAKDGTLVWYYNAGSKKDFDQYWPKNPTEVYEFAANPVTYTLPKTYVEPGGEVYEYDEVTIGGPEIYDTTNAKYIYLTLQDDTQVELLWSAYKADPSILDQYDAKYLCLGSRPLELVNALGGSRPVSDEEMRSTEGKYLIMRLTDGTLACESYADIEANPEIMDQYDRVVEMTSNSSLDELAELGYTDPDVILPY